MKQTLTTDELSQAWERWENQWVGKVVSLAELAMQSVHAGHGFDHVARVAINAQRIARAESANPMVVMPAAWLHDCVLIAKNAPDRANASRLAAVKALQLLDAIDYPSDYLPAIEHAIHAHSFSAAIPCQTLEACVVQDADRLEALGSIGIARCLMTAGSLNQALYHLSDPFPGERPPNDREYSIDHFFAKLLKLPTTMQTVSAGEEAGRRVPIMSDFLMQLAIEIGSSPADVEKALRAVGQSGCDRR